MKCLAHCEAVIDFGDDDREDDVNDSVMWQLLPKVEALKKELGIFFFISKNIFLILTTVFYT